MDPQHPDPAAIAYAARLLREGRLVAFPTETVYGLGAYALDRDAVRRVFAAKGRPAHDPLIVHVASLAGVGPLVAGVPDRARRLAERFWPGPLTLVLRRSPQVPDEVTAALDTVAVRVPAHAVAHALIATAGLPVAAPSANLFSRPSPTCAEHVLQDLRGRIDLVLDAGPSPVGVESTVVDLSGGAARVLRPGAVTLEMLRAVLPDLQAIAPVAPPAGTSLRSPGLLARHYSPRAPLTLYRGEPAEMLERIAGDVRAATRAGQHTGVMLADSDRLPGVDPAAAGMTLVRIGAADDLSTVAARLYAGLRDLDAAGVELILVRSFPATEGLGVAVADRLGRAAAGRVVDCGSSAGAPQDRPP